MSEETITGSNNNLHNNLHSKLNPESKERRVSIGVLGILTYTDPDTKEIFYYLMLNKKRSEPGKPNYGLIGGAIRSSQQSISNALEEAGFSEFTIEGDDLRVSGIPSQNLNSAIATLTQLALQSDPKEQLLGEIREELGQEEIDEINQNMGTNIHPPENLNKIIEEVKQYLSGQPYDIYVLEPEISARDPRQPSQRIALAYEIDLSQTPCLFEYIKNNSQGIDEIGIDKINDNPPLFLKLSREEIKELLKSQKTGENYTINQVSIASQIQVLKRTPS